MREDRKSVGNVDWDGVERGRRRPVETGAEMGGEQETEFVWKAGIVAGGAGDGCWS